MIKETFYEGNFYRFIKIFHTIHLFSIMIDLTDKVKIPFDKRFNTKLKHRCISSISASKHHILDTQINDKDVHQMYKNVMSSQLNFNNIEVEDVVDDRMIHLKRQTRRHINCVVSLRFKLFFSNDFFITNIDSKNNIKCFQLKLKNNDTFCRNMHVSVPIHYLFQNINTLSNKVFIIYNELRTIQQTNIDNFKNRVKKDEIKDKISEIETTIKIIDEKQKKCKNILRQDKHRQIKDKLINKYMLETRKKKHYLLCIDQYIVDSLLIEKCFKSNNILLLKALHTISKKK